MTENQQEIRPALATYEALAKLIDHSLVRPDLTEDEVSVGCRVALEYGAAAVTVRPADVDLAVRILGGSGVVVAGVVGFPHGSSTTSAKLYEGRDLLRRGAKEIEFVVNIGKMLSRQFQHIETELMQMAESCRQSDARFKVNLECGYMATDLKIIACKILKRIEADYVVTSTCFGPSGYSLADIETLKKYLGQRVKIKAAGGVRTLDKALEVYQAGCDRVGATSTVNILEDWKAQIARQAAAATAPPRA